VIHIFGDSFASDGGWTDYFPNAVIHADRGISEYRIWSRYQEQKYKIGLTDSIVFVHTHWSRVYLKDSRNLLPRKLRSHPFCDLMFKNVYDNQEDEFIKTLDSIWDEKFFLSIYNLIVKDMMTDIRGHHFTFFDDCLFTGAEDLSVVRKLHAGDINHLNAVGNSIVHQIVDSVIAP